MFSSRRHLSYANVIATVALVFAMSGGALAASRYLINSTKQINPKVLKKLRGLAGAPGAGGKEGPPGKEGAPGKEGSVGKEGSRGTEGPAGIGPALGAFHNGSVLVTSTEPGNPTVVGTLGKIPAGSYVIIAKLYVFDGAGSSVKVVCKLLAEADGDQVINDLSGSDEIGAFPLQLVHQFNSTGAATVTCYLAPSVPTVYANYIKITAIQVSSLTNTET